MGDPTATFAGTIEPEAPDECFDELGPHGELPTCEWDGTTWVTTYEDTGFGDPGFGAAPGIPPAFLALMAIVFFAGVAMAVYRVSLARRMAVESGMDPSRATAMTMLTDDGLEATYLASSLRGHSPAPDPPSDPTGSPRSVEERLLELQRLRDQGLVTYEEYDARRAAIIDSL